MGSVLAEAFVLGGLGAIIGIVAGIVGAFALSPFLDELTAHRNPLISPDLVVLVIGAAMGMVAALIAAVVPAWSAGRMPVLAALSGRRPPMSSSTRGLVLGVILVATGFGLTSFGALLRLNTSDTSTSTLMLFAGAVLGTLGFGACSPWLLGRLERPSARLPVSSRIALRDLARARSRNGPIVTALLAAFAATVALSSYQASVEASNRARYQPSLFADQLIVQGAGFNQAGPDAATALGAIASGPMYGVGNADRGAWISPGNSDNPEVPHTTAYLTVVNAELAKALGVGSGVAGPRGRQDRLPLREIALDERVPCRSDANQAIDNPVRFAGEYLDPTGLYYLRAREYDPAIGRFISVDPAGASMGDPYTSAYSYAGNNPVRNTDPSGRCMPIAGGAVAVAATGVGLPVAGGMGLVFGVCVLVLAAIVTWSVQPIINEAIAPSIINQQLGESIPVPNSQPYIPVPYNPPAPMPPFNPHTGDPEGDIGGKPPSMSEKVLRLLLAGSIIGGILAGSDKGE